MLLAAFISFTLADAASAYYSPRLGRFLNRDPIGEPGATPVRTGRQPTQFIPRDPIRPDADPNRYAAVRNNPLNLVDPDGMAPTPMPPPWDRPSPAGDDCGIQVHQSPLCLIGGAGGGELGHTWLTWGSGGAGETADCPKNYINEPYAECQKKYVNNKWHVGKVDSGTFADGDQTRSCATASCADIKECLRRRMDTDCHFDLKKSNCRDFVADAMSHCCLKQKDLFYVDWLAPIRYCCSACAREETGVR